MFKKYRYPAMHYFANNSIPFNTVLVGSEIRDFEILVYEDDVINVQFLLPPTSMKR